MVSTKTQLTVNTAGNIVSFNVPEDVFMRDYAEDFCEWIDGTVIKMSPINDKHDKITRYLSILIEAYFELRPIGELKQEPFVMRYEFELEDGEKKRRNREPDIIVILNENLDNLKETYMDGAADIVIEVVSPESAARDYGEKFYEYERASVPEYWIIDPLKKECRFYRLNAKKVYVPQEFDDVYTVAQLPGLQFNVSVLWQANLPGPGATFKAVQAMLET
jgi:Uma2 family endonuclease